MPHVHVSQHPLVKQKLTLLRDVNTKPKKFRELVREISILMAYEATADIQLKEYTVSTPMGTANGYELGEKIGLVPVLRAGLGMADGLIELIPSARQGHIGLYRGDDHRPVEYYVRLPEIEGRTFIVCDPMLATGYSGAHAVQVLIDRGVKPENIRFLALVAAPEGVEAFQRQHPQVRVYVAALDSHLNESAYIVPGLGDAGDRIFGTKH